MLAEEVEHAVGVAQRSLAHRLLEPRGHLGVAIGVIADYLSNAANEAFNRDEFVAANNQALKSSFIGDKDAVPVGGTFV